MDQLRFEDQKTLRLLLQKAAELEDEIDQEANLEEYRELQKFFAADEPESITADRSAQSEVVEVNDEETMIDQEDTDGLFVELKQELAREEALAQGESKDKTQGQQQLPCTVCSNKLAKYTCPGCFRRTCCLNCSRSHKAQFDCLGKANYTKYVEKKSYDDKVAQKDYQYLKMTIENTEFIRKKLSFANHNPELLRLKLLKIYARKKHKIDILSAPTIMTRHRENISFYYMKNKLIYWTFELFLVSFNRDLEFPSFDPQLEKMTRRLIDPVSENSLWRDILCSDSVGLQDDELLLKHAIDLSPGNVEKLLESSQLQLFMKNRYSLNDLIADRDDSASTTPLSLRLPFKIPEDIDNELSSKPSFKERNELYLRFTTSYQMVQVNPMSFIQTSLHAMRINEFPSLYLVHAKFATQFQSKYKCLLL